jgi:hypothetical protein
MPKHARHDASIPPPSVQQLLAFYLEAGSMCAD